MVISTVGRQHFTKEFGEDGVMGLSHRRILPGKDNCAVKVTDFQPQRALVATDIKYPCDETVYIVYGRVRITFPDRSWTELGPDDLYHVKAGESYQLEALEPGKAICFFSRAEDGTMPDNE